MRLPQDEGLSLNEVGGPENCTSNAEKKEQFIRQNLNFVCQIRLQLINDEVR